ncbi:MAG: branched-chain amino acid dehydrogenase, partial [Clostridia bacterium]|nr:branched-chain amino acid dehydrogenase [Clostridia bacterium]
SICDEDGNLFHRGTTQNFNPLMAMAADLVIAETQEIVKTGEIPMESIHTQAIFVDYVVKS